jgi:FkbM family methyltransferase
VDIAGTHVKMYAQHPIAHRQADRAHGERGQIKKILRNINDGSVFWDVGSYTGMYSLFAATAGAETIAIERDPRMVDILSNNITANAVTELVQVLPIALSDEHRIETLQGVDWAGGEKRSTVHLPATTLIESWGIAPPDFVKVDVEGAEREVLEGFGQYLSDCEAVLVEVHSFGDWSVEAATEWLSDRGLGKTQIFDGDGQPHIWATRATD